MFLTLDNSDLDDSVSRTFRVMYWIVMFRFFSFLFVFINWFVSIHKNEGCSARNIVNKMNASRPLLQTNSTDVKLERNSYKSVALLGVQVLLASFDNAVMSWKMFFSR